MGDVHRPDSAVRRRAFLGLAGKGAIAVALGGAFSVLGRGDRYVRPPGALAEAEFLSLCVRCDKCRDVCPYGLIFMVPLEESVVSAGTPMIGGSCPGCRACIYVCPTGALRNDR